MPPQTSITRCHPPGDMGASRSFLPAPAARALFLSLAMAAAASAFFPGAGAGPPLPRPPDQLDAGSNSISATPSSLPAVPRFSTYPPASAPDVMPILPTPAHGAGRAAPAGSMPVIPSNPSPPDPDQLGPTSALAPVGSSAAAVAPSAAAASLSSGACQVAAGALLLLMLLLQRWF